VRELLKHFGSVTQLKAAEPEAIAEVKGIGPQLATTIRETLSR
jgi:excinuclease ABC subunit C